MRLVQAGSAALEHEDSEAICRRSAAVDRASGKYAGVFADGYLAELRQDWPE